MNEFIYVVGTDARDKMISRGYQLLKSNENSDVYVFLNNDTENFAQLDIPCVFSSMLTF
jgi:hypothetical protein